MKSTILAGAVAALMYGTGAAAADGDCPPGHARVDSTSASTRMVAQAPDVDVQEDSIILDDSAADDTAVQQDEDLGIGGSGDVGSSSQDLSQGQQAQGVGGSGAQDAQGEVRLNLPLRCEPVNQAPATGGGGTGGSGLAPQDSGSSIVPQSQPQPEVYPAPQKQPESYQEPQGSVSPQGEDATGGSGLAQPPPATDFRPSAQPAVVEVEPVEVKEKSKNDTKGLTVLIGGGVEGYTGALAPQLNPGPTAGVTVSLKPTSVLGLELGYSGALNNIDSARTGGGDLVDGSDLVRNGGQAALTLAITPTAWQPYLLGGIGINDYNFRGGQELGYSDDTVGSIPVGAGIRGHIGSFTADLRANYNVLFDKEFAPAIDSGGGDLSGGGSYAGTLNIGGTF